MRGKNPGHPDGHVWSSCTLQWRWRMRGHVLAAKIRATVREGKLRSGVFNCEMGEAHEKLSLEARVRSKNLVLHNTQ